MSHTTYFEIGGHVVESYLRDHHEVAPRPSLDVVPQISNITGVPKPLLRAGAEQLKKDTDIDLMKLGKKFRRAQRARWAFTTAGSLAAADGPLPFGDAAAMVLLGVYGAYETYQIFTE